MNSSDLSKRYETALDLLELATLKKKTDPGGYERAREHLGDVVNAQNLWTARVELSKALEQGSVLLRSMDANIDFCLSREGANAGRHITPPRKSASRNGRPPSSSRAASRGRARP